MMTEYDERVKDYWRKYHGNYIVKMIHDAGLGDGVEKSNTMPHNLHAIVLSNSKRFFNNFIHAIIGFYTIGSHYTDTDTYRYIFITWNINIGINWIKLD